MQGFRRQHKASVGGVLDPKSCIGPPISWLLARDSSAAIRDQLTLPDKGLEDQGGLVSRIKTPINILTMSP